MNLDDKRVLITGGSSVPVTDVAAPCPYWTARLAQTVLTHRMPRPVPESC